jgi:hypothetical protein
MLFKKLSYKEIAPIVADYRGALGPDWQVVGRDLLVRFGRFIVQGIWFDRLRDGTCRPGCSVYVLVAPSADGGTSTLAQFLNVKVREFTLQAHSRIMPVVLNALKSEIEPSISRPLDDQEVAKLLISQSKGHVASAYALVCLLAALGRSKEAVQWIAEYHRAFAALNLSPDALDTEREAFLRKVEEWLKLPNCAEQFNAVVEEQKAKLLK